MSIDALEKILGLLKIPTKYAAAGLVVGVALLAAPARVLGWLGFLDYVDKGKPYLGVIVCLLCARLLVDAIGVAEIKFKDHILTRSRHKRMAVLDFEEKEILKRYIEKKSRTQRLNLNMGTVGGLLRDGIIYKATDKPIDGTMDCNIELWAWEYLNDHRNALDGAA